MDYINIHSIEAIKKLLFSPLLSFTELHGIMYITGHCTFRQPGTECKQLLYYMGNKALKKDMPVELPGGRGGVGGCADVDYLAKSLNQVNQFTKLPFNCFSCKFCFINCHFATKWGCFPW